MVLNDPYDPLQNLFTAPVPRSPMKPVPVPHQIQKYRYHIYSLLLRFSEVVVMVAIGINLVRKE